MRKKSEIVAPAGNLEKLRTAFLYGADAAYVGTNIFGLRKYADNFNLDQLKIAAELARTLQRKLYLVLNGYAHNEDLPQVKKLLKEIKNLPLSALIISDLGIMRIAQKKTKFPIHISTQASVTNVETARFWKNLGAKRIVLARELSLAEIKKIKEEVEIEIEIFIHGSRCAGYSGQCVISNYTSKRDANRGGCVQNCRHKFNLGYFMNMRDLMTVDILPWIIEAGVDAWKIEGRMKSELYIASAILGYRGIISKEELCKVSNRTFSHGGLLEPETDYINDSGQSYNSAISYIGIVKEVENDNWCWLEVRNPFCPGETLEYLHPQKGILAFEVKEILGVNFEQISKTRVNQLVKIQLPFLPQEFAVIRKNK